MNFLLAIDFTRFSYYENIVLKVVVITVELAKPGTILPVVREITRIERS